MTNQERVVNIVMGTAICDFCEIIEDPGAPCPYCERDARIVAKALDEAGLLMPDTDPMSEIQAERYYEIRVRRFPGDTHWHSHFQGTEEEVNDFLELNDQLLAIPSEYKRVVHVTTTKEITPIVQEDTDV